MGTLARIAWIDRPWKFLVCNRRRPICKKDLHQRLSIVENRFSLVQVFVTDRRSAVADLKYSDYADAGGAEPPLQFLLLRFQFLLNGGVHARVNALYCIPSGRGFAFAGEASVPLLRGTRLHNLFE